MNLYGALHTYVLLITFPGSIVHVFMRQLLCRLMRVPVFETVYFTVDIPCKYVGREELPPGKLFALICLGCFLQLLLGAVILAPVSLTMSRFGLLAIPDPWWSAILNLLMLWVGFSVLIHSFPSAQELKELRGRLLADKEVPGILRALTLPLYAVMQAGAWLDVWLGVGFVLLLPGLLRALFG